MEGYMTLTPNGLLLDVGVSPENIKKDTNKQD
jgi:hypothetical protein